jgi:hypothetical protein
MDGKLHQKSTYGLSRKLILSYILEALLLTGLGMLAITLHARWRYPLNIPGHHGLEFMALLMLGRSLSRFQFAAGFSSLGIGILLLFPIFGFNDPLMGFYYTLPGFVLDLLYTGNRNMIRKWFVILLISGIAYFMIPISRLIVMLLTGYPYASFLKHGYAVPLISFFLFGTVGGAIGAGTSSIIKKIL